MIREPEDGSVMLRPVSLDLTEGRCALIMEWTFVASRSDVWRLISVPSELRRWAPHTADRDLGSVGKVVFTMLGDDTNPMDLPGEDGAPTFDVDGAVLVADAPVVLEHTWASDVLLWRLIESDESDDGGTTLRLRHTLSDPGMASAVAAGWHTCFEVAAGVLAGRDVRPVRGLASLDARWTDLNERYADALGVEPSRVG